MPVIAIAGNHDSADHLGFGAWMFRRDDLHVRGRRRARRPPITWREATTARSRSTRSPTSSPRPRASGSSRAATPRDDAVTHRDTVRALLRRARAHRERVGARRAVVVAHAFVQGERWPEESRRSERSLYLGGVGAVPALGLRGLLLRRPGPPPPPQSITADGRVRYAGSLMKYSFDEAAHEKGTASSSSSTPTAPRASSTG